MRRTVALLFLVVVAGCASPERVAIPPLPIADQPVSYGDLLTRLRLHSNSANEAFFTDDLRSLSERARDIEQSAGYLVKAVDAPQGVQPRLAAEATKIAAEARLLSQAADAKDEDRIREALRKVHTAIRTLPASELK